MHHLSRLQVFSADAAVGFLPVLTLIFCSWQVLGAVGTLPEIYTELEISYFLLRRLLGVRTEGDKKGAKVSNSDFHLVNHV